MTQSQEQALTTRQELVLWLVRTYPRLTARDAAMHLLSTPEAERSRLDGLCRRGLVGRQYTGLNRSTDRVGYVLTDAGHAALSEREEPEEL